MNFSLTIDCGNAAFDETPASEVARILRELAHRLEQDGVLSSEHGNAFRLFDSNGNRVGLATVGEG